MTYYSSYQKLLKYYDDNCRKNGFTAKSYDEYIIWKRQLKEKLEELIGLDKMGPAPMNCQLIETVQCDGFCREKHILETESGVWMPFYMLIPDSKMEVKFNPIIALHGHGAFAKEGVSGAVHKDMAERVDFYNTAYGLTLVKAGYAVFCPDARGSGERRELRNQGDEDIKKLESSCNSLNNAAISMGMTLTGMWVWDLMKLTDYIISLPFCNKDTLSSVGFSGGGMQSLWLAALDERIQKVVISGYYHSYRGTILRTNQCGCNFVPHLYEYADIGDIGALIAPRPLLIETGDLDCLSGERGITDVIEQVDITREVYEIVGAKEKLKHQIYHGEHKWYGSDVIAWIAKP